MKKLALLLGSLLVVGATTYAKEAVAAPVEVSKEVVVVAEPVVEEVVVVEEEPAFRPTGSLGMTLRYYGETEGCSDELGQSVSGPAANFWNRGGNNRSRLETTFGIQLTEKSKLAIRVRDYKTWESDTTNAKESEDGTETRVQYYFSHNDKFTSRLQYRSEEDDSQNFEYKLIYDLYSNNGGLLSSVTLEPSLYHSQAASNGDNYFNAVGLDIGYAGELPLGFTYDGMVYLDQYFYNIDQYSAATETFDKSFITTWEFYLRRSFGLYTNEKTNVDFNFVGGYDPYTFREHDVYSTKTATTTEKNTYSLYMDLGVSTKYQLTPAVALNGGVGAEYRNWDNRDQSTASTWRWQPYAFVGMKATF